jgi:DNA-binding transcriptional ArsR family regulator
MVFGLIFLDDAILNPHDMREVAEDLSELLKTLAHPGRLLAMCELANGPKSSGELAKRLNLREPAMSQQLAVLRHRGFVTTRRDGQAIIYAVARDDIAALMRFLYRQYCKPDGFDAPQLLLPPHAAAAHEQD